jgi:hypothetical protein
MRNSNLFWGVILILLGVLFVFDASRYFWPILLVCLGLWIVVGSFMRGRAAQSQTVSVDLQGARQMYLKVGHGAGQLHIGAGASIGKALEGECTENVHVDSRLAGDRLEVRVSGEAVMVPFFTPMNGLNWNLRVSNEVPLSLELETGANQSTIDLQSLPVTRLTLNTGASSTNVTLPASGVVSAEVHLGAAEMTLRIPQGMEARIRSHSGLAEINVDTARFPRVNDGYESPNFGASENRIDLTVEAGVGKVSIQ